MRFIFTILIIQYQHQIFKYHRIIDYTMQDTQPTQQQILAEIDQLEAKIRQLTLRAEQIQQEVVDHESHISHAEEEIKNIQLPEHNIDNQAAQRQLTELNHKTEELVKLIQVENQLLQAERQSKKNLIIDAQNRNNALNLQAQQIFHINNDQFQSLRQDLSAAQKNMETENQKNQHLLAQIQQKEQILQKFEAEILSIKNTITHQQKELKNIDLDKEEDLLKQQQVQLAGQLTLLDKQIIELNESYKKQTEKEKTIHENLILLLKNEQQIGQQLTTLRSANYKKINIQEIQLNDSKERVIKLDKSLADDQAHIEDLEKSIKKITEQNKLRLKQINQIQQLLKQEESKKTVKKNYKEIRKKLEKENQQLERELNGQVFSLESIKKTKKAYVHRQNLDILSKQLERHSTNNGPSLEKRQAQLEKLTKENKSLKDNIKVLLRLTKQSEAKQQKLLNQTKKKSEYLLTEKSTFQKLLNTNTNKLNQYEKEFPNHLKDKQAKKAAQIKAKKEEQLKKVQSAQQDKEKQSTQQDTNENESTEHLRAPKLVLPVQSAKKSRLQKRQSLKDHFDQPYVPIYQNTSFQVAIALLVVLVVIGLAQ